MVGGYGLMASQLQKGIFRAEAEMAGQESRGAWRNGIPGPV